MNYAKVNYCVKVQACMVDFDQTDKTEGDGTREMNSREEAQYNAMLVWDRSLR